MEIAPVRFDPRPVLPQTARPPRPETPETPAFSAEGFSISIEIHIERTVMRTMGNTDFQFPAIDALLDHFSPEKTAGRIADFVKRGFGRTSHNDKGSFVDWILPSIRQGVDSALAAFGLNPPDEVKQGAEDTFGRVRELLAEFAGV